MGTTRVTRQAPGHYTEAELQHWFGVQLTIMANEGGRDKYCGNWNANRGLCISKKKFASAKEAEAYFDRELDKNEEVLAVQIGDFSKVWPATKEQKALVQRLEDLRTEEREFDYRILERAKKQKSKTKKCTHCESSINVHKLELPAKADLLTTERWPDVGSCRLMGRFALVHLIGLTDCPVCKKNLLKTDTDVKNYESVKKRLGELNTKVAQAKSEFDKANAGKSQAYWLVAGDCGE